MFDPILSSQKNSQSQTALDSPQKSLEAAGPNKGLGAQKEPSNKSGVHVFVPVDSDRDSVIVVGVRDLRHSVAQPVVTVSPENRQVRFVRLVVLSDTM